MTKRIMKKHAPKPYTFVAEGFVPVADGPILYIGKGNVRQRRVARLKAAQSFKGDYELIFED